MKKLVVLLVLCLALCPMSLAETEEPSAADEFLSNLSKTWDSFLDMTAEAGKDAAQWARDSGVAQWAQDAASGVSQWAQDTAEGVSQWAQESGVAQWAQDTAEGVSQWAQGTAQGVQEYMDEVGPKIDNWLAQNGAKVARNARYFADSIQGVNTYFPKTENFVGTWYVDDYILQMTHDSPDPAVLSCVITKYIDDHSATCWVYDECVYDDIGDGLSTFEIGTMTNLVLGEDHEVVSSQQIWSDGAASFFINDAGQLVWTNYKTEPGTEDMVFEKVVEDTENPMSAFEGEWVADRAVLTIEELDDALYVDVRWGGSAGESTFWGYGEAAYDAETNTISTKAGIKSRQVFDESGELVSSEDEYTDGEALIRFEEDGSLFWNDLKENAGEGLTFVKNDAQDAGPKTIAPKAQDIDVNRLFDGCYAVNFTPDDVVSGEDGLTIKNVHIFTQDRYDAADIDAMAVGDSIIVEGETVPVLTLEKGEEITVNAEQDARAFYLMKPEGGDEYVVMGMNDLTTFTEHGVVDLVVDEEAVFTDASDLDSDTLNVNFDGIAEAITTSQNDSFTRDNTVIWVEGGRIVEIVRTYMP